MKIGVDSGETANSLALNVRTLIQSVALKLFYFFSIRMTPDQSLGGS